MRIVRDIGLVRVLGLFFPLLLGGFSVPAQGFANEDCATCHADTGGDPAEVTADSLAMSVHAGMDCMACHIDIVDLPHADVLEPVDCAGCHSDIGEIYEKHGRGRVGIDPDIPTCVGCHGSHDIRGIDDKKSLVHPLNLPRTCGTCHEDDEFTETHGIRFKHPVRVFSKSVHGHAAQGGVYAAATCNDCHSTNGSAHMILAPGDIRSMINHFNIPRTCGVCHKRIEQDYWEGIHGQLTERGEVSSPICTTCHGEHNILPTLDPRSPVSASRLAEATCSPCHESAALNEKYELPTGRLTSFRDSYHGLKSKAGDATVANCASCHGAHRILPSTDPTSTIHPRNLQGTCGGCHPSISAQMAETPIHASSTLHQTGAAGVVRKIYIVLIALVIGSMILHWLVDLRHQIWIVMRKKRQVRRMELDEVVQHFILALSFTVLVITGFSLRFYDSWWSVALFGWDGGFSFRGVVHRGAGIVLLLASFWHFLFLLTPRGKRFLRDMLPRRLDFTQFHQTLRYNLGLGKEHPAFGRFSYVEKAEYWALVWGTVVMGITGLFLWYEDLAVRWFPKGFLDVMLVIHYYEAWLAFLAILIWHMYSTIFSPKVYPMNPSWLTGTMPEEQFLREHPLAEVVYDDPETARRLHPAAKMEEEGAKGSD